MNAAVYILIVSALSTAVFHTLIPDHWLPFVLIGKARNWSVRRTALISSFSAVLHITLSLIMGIVGLIVGLGTSMAVGETLQSVSGVLLILFGFFYAYWSFRKGGHFHIGGKRVHHDHDDGREEKHEGHDGKEVEHWHPDMDIISGQLKRSDWYLAFIIGLNPCVLIFPLLFAAVPHGFLTIIAVAFVYSITTSFLMVGLTLVALIWVKGIRMEFFAKYGEMISGIFIAAMGLLFLILE